MWLLSVLDLGGGPPARFVGPEALPPKQPIPMPTIAVLSPHRHPRLRYVLREVGRELGWTFRLLTDADKWAEAKEPAKISFREKTGGVTPCVENTSNALLRGGHPSPEDLAVVPTSSGLPAFFYGENGRPDYLACIFFVLSRYEEYQPFEPDEHGRFSAGQSHARRNGYLHRPVVREWAAAFAAEIRAVFPDLPAPVYPDFVFRPTYDIDLLWAWRYRGLRGVAAGLRDVLTGHPRRAVQRFTAGAKNDPYQALPSLEALHRRARLSPIYFWLLADGADRRDPNPYPIPAKQVTIMRELAERYTAGIHPGYLAVDQPERFSVEAERLTEILGKSTRHSRQHFLRLRFPDTYRELRHAGITHDHTMGYADAIGWRAGTNRAFFWYDLEREEQTSLLVHPFAAMDVTLKNYLKLTPGEAKTEVLKLAHDLQSLGGEFQLLWHNSSFSAAYGWAGWWKMYEEMVEELGATTALTPSS